MSKIQKLLNPATEQVGNVEDSRPPKRGKKNKKRRINLKRSLKERKTRTIKEKIIIKAIKLRVLVNLNLVVTLVQLHLIDLRIGRVATALILDLVIMITIMVVMVLVIIKAGITIIVLTNSEVVIVMIVAHNIIMVHDIMMVHNMTTVALNTKVSVVMKTALGLVIFKNPLERRIRTPPSL